MSENIIFEQIKLGACVILLFRVILSGKKSIYSLFFVIKGHLQGHLQEQFQIKGMKMSIPRSKMKIYDF